MRSQGMKQCELGDGCTLHAVPPAHLSNIDPSSLRTLPVVLCHSCHVAVASQLIRTPANTVTVYMNAIGREGGLIKLLRYKFEQHGF